VTGITVTVAMKIPLSQLRLSFWLAAFGAGRYLFRLTEYDLANNIFPDIK